MLVSYHFISFQRKDKGRSFYPLLGSRFYFLTKVSFEILKQVNLSFNWSNRLIVLNTTFGVDLEAKYLQLQQKTIGYNHCPTIGTSEIQEHVGNI